MIDWEATRAEVAGYLQGLIQIILLKKMEA